LAEYGPWIPERAVRRPVTLGKKEEGVKPCTEFRFGTKR